MQDSVSMPRQRAQQDVRPSPHQSRYTTMASAFRGLLTSKRPWHYFSFLACALTAVVAFFAGTVYVTYLLEHRNDDMADARFCCPDEAAQMAWYVNASVKPCSDFFAYVCSNVISDGHWIHDDETMQHWGSLITGHTTAGMRGADAAKFVAAYYRSCMEVVPRRPDFLHSLASAMVKVAWKGAGAFKSREAFAYMVAVSAVYELPSVVYVSYKLQTSETVLKISRVCKTRKQDSDAIAPVVDALRETFNATTTEEAVAQFILEVCNKFPAGRRITKKKYTTTNKIGAFSQEVWDVDDVEAGLGRWGFSLRNATSIEVQGVREIRTLYESFAAGEDRDATAKTVAYLVWYSVATGSREFYTSYDGTAPSVHRVCVDSLYFISELHQAFAVALFTSRDKDVEARKIFARVKNAVYTDCQSYMLIDAEDSQRFQGLFEELQIVAYTETGESAVPIPKGTESFGENVLRGRAYGFEVVKRQLASQTGGTLYHYGEVEFPSEKWLRLSSIIYKDLSPGSGERSLPHYSMVGALLADALWYMVLELVKWSSRTRASIKALKRCFAQSYPGGNDPRAAYSLAIRTLSLMSTLKALNMTDWYGSKVATNTWRVSHAQFFYILTIFYTCPRSSNPTLAQAVNASLQYVEDFANAFHCPKSDALMKSRRCFLELQRRP
ncbi:hypothetical protein HPB49_017480 [Dermacentor silvarum]|uniref:Uncharacterized protein n=1 Tax=Dermacentor silvarum TaxID=543639 RepID=A0ACB8DQH2_DERSI|nr:hypothetical protein HPB49_017480 [Dermacentor silvarum]